MDWRRFLEYTEEHLSRTLGTLATDVTESLLSWPCLFTQEGRGDEKVTLAQLSGVRRDRTEIVFSLEPVADFPEIVNADLWRLSGELDIGEWEFTRNHWAVKEKDLFDILGKAGFTIPLTVRSHFVRKPLLQPTRSSLFAARDAISNVGHTRLDEIVLHAGVHGLSAPRDLTMRDRANAIARFAIENPAAVTAENELFSTFLLRTADVTSDATAPLPELGRRPSEEPLASAVAPAAEGSRAGKRVFVVHGRNESIREQVVSYLESLGLEPVVLHEQPNMGQHLLTKFIREAELVTFAVVLMTDDDEGARKGQTPRSRARQNVILELGYFLSLLKQSHVCALITPDLETPSDFDGILYIRMMDDRAWQKELRRELVAANIDVNSA